MAAKWYALPLAGSIAVALMAVGVHRLLVGNDAEFRLEATTILLVPVALVVTLFIGPLQEELGWRGYALPRLLRRWSSVRASLVLGVAWACWHLPLYAIDAVARSQLPWCSSWCRSSPCPSSTPDCGVHWREPAGRRPLHSAINVAGVLLLRDAGSDLRARRVATVITIALAAVAARQLSRMREASSNSRGR